MFRFICLSYKTHSQELPFCISILASQENHLQGKDLHRSIQSALVHHMLIILMNEERAKLTAAQY